MDNIFKVAYKKSNKHLLKINKEGEDIWMNTNEEVYNYAKEKFEDGDKIGIEYIIKGKLYHIIRINKEGDNVEKKEGDIKTSTNDLLESRKEDKNIEDGYHCLDCGKELKDDKYKKCYTCNQKNPVKSTNTSFARSPETVASIKMQCAYKVAATAITVLTGQIDLTVLKEMLDDLAEHIVKKF